MSEKDCRAQEEGRGRCELPMLKKTRASIERCLENFLTFIPCDVLFLAVLFPIN